jgi:pyrroline-5-carboxylate reductase
MSDNSFTIGFIGAGNMATALISGLAVQGWQSNQIWASDTDQGRLDALSATGINTSMDNQVVIASADVVILAVKPQVMADVLIPLRESLSSRHCLLVSIAAGISMDNLLAWTHPQQAIVRCMPNTPALVGKGASALFGNAHVSDRDRDRAATILSAVGLACWLNREADMDTVTALSGSGPAYFFLLMEAMLTAAIDLGLDPETAEQLCKQTALGAAELAMQSDVDVAELRHRVTSPGGTTEAALRQFASEGFNAMVARALGKAADRSRELAVPANTET